VPEDRVTVPPTRPTGTILMVDDSPLAVSAIVRLLEHDGHSVLLAESGAEALRLAEAARPDLILLDVMLPGMDGFEVCLRLRASPAVDQVPVIMLTALDDRASRLRGFEVGADDFISKPVDTPELLSRVRTIIRLGRFRRLAAEREKLAQLLQLAPDAVYVIGPAGRLLMTNRIGAQMLERASPDDLVGRTFAGFVAEPHRREYQVLHRELLDGHAGPRVLRFPLVGLDGTVTIMDGHAGAVPWGDEPVVLLVAREASVSSRAPAGAEALAGVSRLAAPLAETIERRLSTLEHALAEHRDRGEIAGAIDALDRLARALAFFSGRTPVAPVPVELAGLLADAAGRLRAQQPDRVVELDVPAGSLRAEVDPHLMALVLDRILANSVDATEPDETIHLRLRGPRQGADPGDAEAVILIEDRGAGMEEAALRRALEPCFSTKPERDGLGLSVAYGLVTAQGGRLRLRSEPGQGTVVAITFPLHRHAAPAAPGGA
jgi:PAS domain S-box-containing protein